MLLEDLIVYDAGHKKHYSSTQIMAALDGTASARTTIPATYRTSTASPTVYYTALNPDGTTLTARGTSGVTLLASGLYQYLQPRTADFVAVWDEGDVSDYTTEYVMVGS